MAEADRLFAASDKAVRISPEFDAPQFCRDWFAVDPTQVKLACIMVRGPKVGDDGKLVLRKGVQVMTWLPYVERGQVQQLVVPAAREKESA
jgi:NAD-dependent oxidoreductase involved in siderophore biosynthesis